MPAAGAGGRGGPSTGMIKPHTGRRNYYTKVWEIPLYWGQVAFSLAAQPGS